MSRNDLYRIAGVQSDIGLARPRDIDEIARILYRRNRNFEIGYAHCQRVAAQFLANFDHRYRKERKSLLAAEPSKIYL